MSYVSILGAHGFVPDQPWRYTKALPDRRLYVSLITDRVTSFSPRAAPHAFSDSSHFRDSSELELAVTYQSLRPLPPPEQAPR